MKTKILVIYTQLDRQITGGQVYDNRLFEKIKKDERYELDFLTDNMLCSQKKALFNFAYLREYFRVRKYDIIITNSRLYTRLFLLFFFLRWTSKVKLIAVHHHFDFLGQSKKIFKFLELNFLRMLYATIIPSPYIKDLFATLFPKKKVLYAQLSVEKAINNVSAKKDDKCFNLVTVGTIEKRKGISYIIDAISNIKDKTNVKITFSIVGKIVEEDYYNNLVEQIKNAGLTDNVKFLGRLSNEELSEVYSKANCFAFGSQLEGYGMVLLEAMSYGLPLIAFNNTAMPYTVKDGHNGFLVENKNTNEFSNAILKLIEDPQLCKKLAEGSLNDFKNLRTLEDLNSDFDSILNNKFERIK